MEYGKSELIRLLRNVMREGWSDQKIKDLVDSLWRDKYPGADEVIYGYVTWEGGLNFTGSMAKYRKNNRLYNAPQKSLTCAAADATYTRIDLAALSTDREWVILPGTPAENPMPPTDYDRSKYLDVVPIEIPALATQPANMVEGQIYNEHIAGEWTPSVVGTTADFDSTVGPSLGSKCAAIGALTNGNMIVFTAATDHKDTDWSTLSFDLQLPNSNSKSNFIEAYFTRNGRACSKLVPATFSRLNLNWQKVVFAIPDFAVRNSIFNGLVLRWNNSGGTYAGIKIDNVRLQKGIELPATTDNYSTGIDWDEATQTLTIHRTGSLGPLVKQLTGIGGGGDDGKSAYEIAVLNGFEGTEAEWLESLVGDDGYTPQKGVDYDDGVPVEISVQSGWVCWRYVGAPSWTQLYQVPAADNSVEVYIDFLDTTPFVFTAPYAMKFTSQTAENGAATLNPVLNTNLAQYDDVTITPAAAGLVTLTGEKL